MNSIDCVYQRLGINEESHLGGNNITVEGDPAGFMPNVWGWIIREYGIKTILDVGCGNGRQVNYFNSIGMFTVGLEGLSDNVSECLGKGLICIKKDITTLPILRLNNIDLVNCIEVAEHIEEKFVDNFIGTITVGRILCLTAAPPEQTIGYHHVNLKTNEYWIEKIEKVGYSYLKDETKILKDFKEGWFYKSGMLFKKVGL